MHQWRAVNLTEETFEKLIRELSYANHYESHFVSYSHGQKFAETVEFSSDESFITSQLLKHGITIQMAQDKVIDLPSGDINDLQFDGRLIRCQVNFLTEETLGIAASIIARNQIRLNNGNVSFWASDHRNALNGISFHIRTEDELIILRTLWAACLQATITDYVWVDYVPSN